MIHNLNNEKEFVQLQFDNLLAQVNSREQVLVIHHGELSQNVISTIENCVEEKISNLVIAKSLIKKIFHVSVETLQNIYTHGHKNKNGEQHNFFILSKNNNHINVISANLISNNLVSSLETKIDAINSFSDKQALKEHYLEHLEKNTMSEKGGAGLGFITIGIKSGNELKTEFKKINNDFSLFILISSINLV